MPDAAPDIPPASGRLDVVIAIVARAGEVLICQRPPDKSFAGYWEFPGGKREPGETIEQCLRRELREELAIEVEPAHGFRVVDHDYPRGRIRLHPFLCSHVGGEPKPLACQQVRWVAPQDLTRYQFPPANDDLLRDVARILSQPPPAAPAAPG